MNYSKEWSILGSALVLIGMVIVIFVLFYFFTKSDFYRYINTYKYKGNKPYFLPKGESIRINRNRNFLTNVGKAIISEDLGFNDLILTSTMDTKIYFKR